MPPSSFATHERELGRECLTLPAIWPEAVHDGAPGQRRDDKDAAVRGIHPPELGRALEGDDDAVADQHQRAEQAKRPGTLLAQELPHQPATADLGQTGDDDQQQGASDSGTRLRYGSACFGLRRLRITAVIPAAAATAPPATATTGAATTAPAINVARHTAHTAPTTASCLFGRSLTARAAADLGRPARPPCPR